MRIWTAGEKNVPSPNRIPGEFDARGDGWRCAGVRIDDRIGLGLSDCRCRAQLAGGGRLYLISGYFGTQFSDREQSLA